MNAEQYFISWRYINILNPNKEPKMRVGITGTREGLNGRQIDWLTKFIDLVGDQITEFHHGDCVGADIEASRLFKDKTEAKIHVHPPVNDAYRARGFGDVVYPETSYMRRNRDIVRKADIMIAFPRTRVPQTHSGTWLTINIANQQDTPSFIIKP